MEKIEYRVHGEKFGVIARTTRGEMRGLCLVERLYHFGRTITQI